MRIEISRRDQVMKRYAAQLDSLGKGKAKVVMNRALNYEGRKAFTQVKRDVKVQGSFTSGMIKGMKFKSSGGNKLETSIVAPGTEINIRGFGARQFAYGTRAKVWNKFQKYPHTFAVARYGGLIYKRKGPGRGPIEQVWGPNLAREVLKDNAPKGYFDSLPRIVDRVAVEIAAALRGY